MSKYWSKLRCWRQETRFPGLSRGVVCVILPLAFLIQYWLACDTQTHIHTMTAITRAELASSARVKTEAGK